MGEAKGEVRYPQKPMAQIMAPPPSPLVLLAEDDDPTREDLVGALEDRGYRVIALDDGLELRDYVELATRAPLRVRLPDVVLADEHLPGLASLKAFALVRRHFQVACVMLVSRRDTRTLRRAKKALVAETIVKPVAFHELDDVLSRLVVPSTPRLRQPPF